MIALTGLPAAIELTYGDCIGLKWDAVGDAAGSYRRRTKLRVVEPATASGAGAISVIAEPPIDTRVVPATAVAHLDKPLCLMRLIPDASDLGDVGAGGAFEGGTIVAVQELRA